MSRRPEYTYSPKGNLWVIHKMTYRGRFASGDKVATFHLKEDARRECYRLNGWKYKEQPNE